MSFFENLESKLAAGLALDLPYRRQESQLIESGTPAAVLVLIGLVSSIQDPEIFITRRTDLVETHKGQFAFPGGVCDPEDHLDQGLVTTALRETYEEVGIQPSEVKIVGRLPELWTVTGFLVTPVVGLLKPLVEEVQLSPSPNEISEMFWISLRQLSGPGVYRKEYYQLGQVRYPIDVFQVGERRIWGATGSILKNLLDRLSLLG
jgi:8-oxo-dGTP pyrophosphatase MutT (NUDIX family)